jgi:tetratricopeptide (TPR) repeat protein
MKKEKTSRFSLYLLVFLVAMIPVVALLTNEGIRDDARRNFVLFKLIGAGIATEVKATATGEEVDQEVRKIDAYLRLLELKGTDKELQFSATLLREKGERLLELNKPKEAAETFEELARRFAQHRDNNRILQEVQFAHFYNERLNSGKVQAASLDDILQHFADKEEVKTRLQGINMAFTRIFEMRTGRFFEEKSGEPSEKIIAAYDRLYSHFRHDKTPEIQVEMATALSIKGASQFERLGDPSAALDTLSLVLRDYCASGFKAQFTELCHSTLSNTVEPLLALNRNDEALKRIDEVLALNKERDVAAIMAYFRWLAQPETSTQTVRHAILAVPKKTRYHWTFSGIRRHTETLPELRRARANCFMEYFETDGADGIDGLDSCLNSVDERLKVQET